ncbi:MAG: diguanylate cyclase [Gallionellaceae bacterium]
MIISSLQFVSIKTKVTAFTLAVFGISLLLGGLYAGHILRKDMQRQLGEQQMAIASLEAEHISFELNDRIRGMQNIAERITPALMRYPKELQNFLEARPFFTQLFNAGGYVTGNDGVALASIPLGIPRIGVNYMNREYVATAIKQGKITISDPSYGIVLKVPVIGIAVPIFNDSKQIMGALVGIIDLSKPNILDAVTQNPYGETGGYLLVSKHARRIVTATDKDRIMEASPALGVNPLIDRFLQGEEGTFILRTPRGKEVLQSVKSIPVADWYLAVQIPTEEAFAPIVKTQRYILWGMLLLMVVAGSLIWWWLRLQLSPLLSTAKTLAQMTDALKPLPVTSRDEVGQLAASFNSLLDTLGKRELYLQAIIENEPECIKIIDAQGRLKFMNPAGLAMIEAESINQVSGKFIGSFIAPECRLNFDSLHKRVLAGETVQMEFEVIGLKGGHRWLETHAVPLKENGQTMHLAVTRDVSQRKQFEEKLLTLSTAIEQSPISVLIADAQSNIEYVNPRFSEVTGYFPEELIGQNTRILQSGETPKEIYKELWSALRNGNIWHGELLNKRKDSQPYWEEVHIAPVKNNDGVLTHYVAARIDVSQRKKIEADLSESESRFRFMLETSPIAIRITQLSSNQVLFANQRYAELIKTPPEQVIGTNPQSYYVNPQDYADVLEQLAHGARVTNKLIELQVSNQHSKTTWTLASYMRLDFQGEPAVLGWFYDISDRKAMEEQVQHLAHFDALTDLPNRTLFTDRLHQALAVAKRDKTHLALMFIDLDKFKPVNDTLGHDVGDQLLKGVALRIKTCLRESDTVARIGGDEFVVLLSVIESASDAIGVAEKIRRSLNIPFGIDGHEVCISSSTGVAIYPDHGNDEKELVKNADTAMYFAKKDGRNNAKVYAVTMG